MKSRAIERGWIRQLDNVNEKRKCWELNETQRLGKMDNEILESNLGPAIKQNTLCNNNLRIWRAHIRLSLDHIFIKRQKLKVTVVKVFYNCI